jgi:hypothetical protein
VHQVTRLVVRGAAFRSCMGLVLMTGVGGRALRSSAEVQNPKDTVAQEKHTYQEESRELPPRRSDENRSADVDALHRTHSTA